MFKVEKSSAVDFLVHTRFIEEMWYEFLFTMFFTAAHFHLGGL